MENTFVSVIKAIYKFFCPFKMLSNMLKEQTEYLQCLEIRILRLEIMHTIERYPAEREKIMSLYDEYKEKGGNSYIDGLYKAWEKRANAKSKSKRKKK